MTHKRANLSLQVVVIASIVLIVLIVLTVIFTSRMARWNEGLRHCDTVCKSKAVECEEEGYDELPIYMDNCKDDQGNAFRSPAYCCRIKEN